MQGNPDIILSSSTPMAGIIFFRTKVLDTLKKYYIREIGMDLWLEQADCIILQHGNMFV
jgi:hypothetical protein